MSTRKRWPLRAVVSVLLAVVVLGVVAEGMEQESQLADLVAAGCDAAQGFYFSRPLSPEAVETLLSGAIDPVTAAEAPR